VDTQGNPATLLQRVRDAQGILRAALTGDPIRSFPVLCSIHYQTLPFKFRAPHRQLVIMRARLVVACSPDWSL
jgi:hypothetical protein